jgi:lipopolysaccharide transport system ATP-binding protein
MSEIAIRVDNLSKRYRIGLQEEVHDTLVGAVIGLARQPLENLRRLRQLSRFDDDDTEDTIWALKDVSFEVKQGEVVGIIGRNGAGKTTLLKILSRITHPTRGRAELQGRVSSLLEVGTGFHPELTGRENVYLNGTILGMRKIEIDQKFDEILEFSGIEKFIDTPVKRYSSGMRVRLAFSVAAHLEPEILLVDEVLAVGDVAFQKKCLDKMEDVSKAGRTVLFVSHNMAAVEGLCRRGLVMDAGRIVFDGEIRTAIDRYVTSLVDFSQSVPLHSRVERSGNGRFCFTEIRFKRGPNETDTFVSGEPALIEMDYEADGQLNNVSIAMPFKDHYRQAIFQASTKAVGCDFELLPPRGRIVLEIANLPLREGRYVVNLWCEVNGLLADWVIDAAAFHVVEGDFFGTGMLPPSGQGQVLVEHSFRNETVDATTPESQRSSPSRRH